MRTLVASFVLLLAANTGEALTAVPTSPGAVGMSVTFVANGGASYLWVIDDGTGWNCLGSCTSWEPSGIFVWHPAAPGSYRIAVWIRQSGVSGPVSTTYDEVQEIPFQVMAAPLTSALPYPPGRYALFISGSADVPGGGGRVSLNGLLPYSLDPMAERHVPFPFLIPLAKCFYITSVYLSSKKVEPARSSAVVLDGIVTVYEHQPYIAGTPRIVAPGRVVTGNFTNNIADTSANMIVIVHGYLNDVQGGQCPEPSP